MPATCVAGKCLATGYCRAGCRIAWVDTVANCAAAAGTLVGAQRGSPYLSVDGLNADASPPT